MLNQGYKAVPIQEIESTIMARIMEVRDQLKKGQLTIQYSTTTANEKPTLERIFAEMDQDYLAIHRELETAKSEMRLLKVQSQNSGSNNNASMQEVLEFQIESAKSALETRLLELKTDNAFMVKALLRLEQEDKWFMWSLERRKTIAEQKKKMLMEEQNLKRIQKEIQKKKDAGWSVIYMIMGLSIIVWLRNQQIRVQKAMQKMNQEQATYEAMMRNLPQRAA